jgi:hypothetical protein
VALRLPLEVVMTRLLHVAVLLLEIGLVLAVLVCPWTLAAMASVALLVLLGWSWHEEVVDARPAR